MSAIAGGLDLAIQAIPTDQAGGYPLTWDDLADPLTNIAVALTILRDAMNAADSATTEAVTAATDAATQIEEMGDDFKRVTHHTYEVVIPHSLSWLAGYVVSRWIDPLRADVAYLADRVSFLLGWRDQIDAWRHNFVDPNVEKWVGFREWFDTWPQGILFKWRDWLTNPDLFAQWAAPPLIGPLVSYLAAPEHEQTRDNLALIALQAWQEVPNQAWERILQYMVMEK